MELNEAVRANDPSEVERLLQAGADPEQSDGDFPTPNLKRFVQAAGKAMLTNEVLGHTALFYAARYGHAHFVARLIEAGGNPNRRDFLDQTPLIWAAEGGHLEAIRSLLQGGAQADNAALSAALAEKQPECALELLQNGAQPDLKALVQAAELAAADLLKKMLQLKPKLKAGKALAHVGYATRLLPAAQAPPGRWTTIFNQHGSWKRVPEPEDKILEAMEVLLQAGAGVNEVSSVGPALYVAASQGLTRVVQRLLEAGADPQLTYRERTPKQVALLLGHSQTAELL